MAELSHPQNRAAPGSVLFIDESKAHGYTVVAAVARPDELADLRRAIDGLRLNGQRRVHFAKERDSRRRLILSTLVALNVRALAYQAHKRDDLDSRSLCLRAVAADVVRLGARRIVLEQDDSIVSHDRQLLYDALHLQQGEVTYAHERAAAEPLLAVPDAIAWAIARGGDWRRRVDPMIVSMRQLP